MRARARARESEMWDGTTEERAIRVGRRRAAAVRCVRAYMYVCAAEYMTDGKKRKEEGKKKSTERILRFNVYVRRVCIYKKKKNHSESLRLYFLLFLLRSIFFSRPAVPNTRVCDMNFHNNFTANSLVSSVRVPRPTTFSPRVSLHSVPCSATLP